MRKLLLILILFLSVLSKAQQDNTQKHSISSKGNCIPRLADTYHDKDTITLSVLLKHPCITVPCGKVLSFCVSVPVNGVYVDKQISGNYFIQDLLEIFKSDKYDCYIILKAIWFQTDNSSQKMARGMLIHLLKK